MVLCTAEFLAHSLNKEVKVMNQGQVVERIEAFRSETFKGVPPTPMLLLAGLCFGRPELLGELKGVLDANPEEGCGSSADEGVVELAVLVSALRSITQDYEVIPHGCRGLSKVAQKRSLTGEIRFDRLEKGGDFRKTIQFSSVEVGVVRNICGLFLRDQSRNPSTADEELAHKETVEA